MNKRRFKNSFVYEEDFRKLLKELKESSDKAYEDAEGESVHCNVCNTYSLELETACYFVREIADKTEDALRKKSYINHHHRKENRK